MLHRSRRLGAVVLSIGTVCAVTACGSSAKSGSGSTATVPSGRSTPVGFKLTSSQRSCLKKQGVTIPTGGLRSGSRGTAPNSGSFPKGKFPKGKLPKGTLPKGARFKKGALPGGARGAAPATFAKRRAAFKACGVTLPAGGGQGAPPAGAAAG